MRPSSKNRFIKFKLNFLQKNESWISYTELTLNYTIFSITLLKVYCNFLECRNFLDVSILNVRVLLISHKGVPAILAQIPV